MLIADPYFVTVAVIAVLIVGLSKAGLLGSLGMVGVPLLTLIMPARDAAGVMLPVLLAMDAIAVDCLAPDSNVQVWPGQDGPADILQKIIHHATRANVASTWVQGACVHQRHRHSPA